MASTHWLMAPRPGGFTPALRHALGPLSEVVDDPRVTDVFLTGAGTVFADTGEGTYAVSGVQISPQQGVEIARGLIELGGRHVDEGNPLVDVNLGGGVRVHVVLAPIAHDGPEISVRIQRHHKAQLEHLSLESAPTIIPLLIAAVRERKTLLISGATGSGKTTLLGALMAHVPPTERLVVLEDLAELSIDHPHVVGLECRQANIEGTGEVDLTRLVREALRMRPTRLVVGECRGGEIADLLRAFHTGHSGGATTVHARSLQEVPIRLESLAALAGMSSSQIARQAASAIDLLIHVEPGVRHTRRLTVGRFLLNKKGVLHVVPPDDAAAWHSAQATG